VLIDGDSAIEHMIIISLLWWKSTFLFSSGG
jgi:hypothetical protein